jgi:ribitol 2-dehydrogenase
MIGHAGRNVGVVRETSHMIARGSGDIIVTSSVAGHYPVPWEAVYSDSKWAMTCFVRPFQNVLDFE